jgi:hypothetical protein
MERKREKGEKLRGYGRQPSIPSVKFKLKQRVLFAYKRNFHG